MEDDDSEEEEFEGLFEDGHWVWDDSIKGLLFLSDRISDVVVTSAIAAHVPAGPVDFKDEIDLLEQVRFRKRFARKVRPGQPDVITLQDIKDLALYTAPVRLLSPMLINLLHTPTTERFIRSLIFYCQYYLQISDEMKKRIKDLETKVRTREGDIVEGEFSENLSDLRALVAKEYSTLLIGGAETRKYHHMGPMKKRRSLSVKDSKMYETLLRICVQIVWIALSRRSFNQIELEISRLFKSDTFNSVEHMLKTNIITKLTKEERNVLLGRCLRHDKKLYTCSPLMNETFCHRYIDYRMMGLGVIKYDDYLLTPRIRYMMLALSAPEEELAEHDVPCGILGLPRSLFDTMLHILPDAVEAKGKSKSSMTFSITSKKLMSSNSSGFPRFSKCAMGGTQSKTTNASKKKEPLYVYSDIILPQKEIHEPILPDYFPDKPAEIRRCSERQRIRWQARLYRLLHPPKRRRSVACVGPGQINHNRRRLLASMSVKGFEYK